MENRTKILHIFYRMERGGAETRTVEIMRKIDRDKYDFHFAVSLPGSLEEEIRSLGGTIHRHPLRKYDLFYPSWFRNLLQRERFDVVHAHNHYTSGYFLRLAHQVGVPQRIVHFRNTSDGKRCTFLRRMQLHITKSWIDKYATDILAVCKAALAESWPTCQSDSRCQIVYNGLDLTPFHALPERQGYRRKLGYTDENFVVIHVGRHAEQKNCFRLLKIFNQIRYLCPTAKLLMIGTGNSTEEKKIDKWIQELKLENEVQRLGRRSNVPDLLTVADMMLFPSLWEGLPGAVLEACATGLPVLASELPGTREIAQYFSNVNCLSLEKNDLEWSVMAREIFKKDVAGNANLRTGIKQFYQTPFTLEKCTNQLCDIWSGALNSTRILSENVYQKTG